MGRRKKHQLHRAPPPQIQALALEPNKCGGEGAGELHLAVKRRPNKLQAGGDSYFARNAHRSPAAEAGGGGGASAEVKLAPLTNLPPHLPLPFPF